MSLAIISSDLTNPQHCQGLIAVLDSYATDATGGGKPLPQEVRANLIPRLRQHPTTVVLLAQSDGQTVGAAVCFVGFSTFRARPLLNIHDLAVLPAFRGRGAGRKLLEAAENEARQRKCCKLTLEVLDSNAAARHLYAGFGFVDFELPTPVVTRFLSKSLAE